MHWSTVPEYRKTTRRGRPALVDAALVFLVAFTVHPASGLVPDYQIEDLTHLSTDVVIGEVTGATSAWQDWPYGGRVIMTTYTVRVDNTLKGKAAETISVVVPGGTVGTTTISASDCPTLTVGMKTTLFLKKDLQGRPRYWIFGLERGAWEVSEATLIPLALGVTPIRKTDLEARVRRAVEAENDGR
jgi:hypothetical protein